MKTTRERIVEALRDEYAGDPRFDSPSDLLYSIVDWILWNGNSYDDGTRRGGLDDILGIPSPTLTDVTREAERKLHPDARVWDMRGDYVRVFETEDEEESADPCIIAPTLASAYAALRALPDREASK